MAGVSVSKDGGGRKPIDSNINMIPMIDLLLSVIAFLLMTAVWVQTGAIQAQQPTSARGEPPPPAEPQFKIMISAGVIRVGASEADAQQIEIRNDNFDGVRTALARYHSVNAAQREVWIQPDSAVSYNDIIRVMDTVYEVWGASRPSGRSASEMVTMRFL